MKNCDHKNLDLMILDGKELLFFVCSECDESFESQDVLGDWRVSVKLLTEANFRQNKLNNELAKAAEEIARLKIKNATLQAENDITSRIR